MSGLTRRHFLKTGMGMAAASLLSSGQGVVANSQSGSPAGMRLVASANGIRATEKAMELMRQGSDLVDAVIAGVTIVEEDPNETSVGYGGLPNEEGVVELDASVMSGPTHSSGAVAALRNIKTPSQVAKLVMERTDHCLLVGEGALKFALAHGFKEENLLTEKSREAWLRWRETHSDKDNSLPPKPEKMASELKPYLYTHGTINCLALDSKGDLAGVTSTSGRSYKLPGRVGDSPIIGAGLYVDNAVGAAGSTGRGEANILNCGSYQVVAFMAQGFSPEEACLKTLERIVRTTKLQSRLLDQDGRPDFDLNFFALNKKGQFGSARMWSGGQYAVHDGKDNQLREAAYLFKAKK